MKDSMQQCKRPTLALNRAELDKLHSLNEKQLAAKIGVDESTLWRITNGEVSPSPVFIAKVKIAFPAMEFDKLYRIVDTAKVAA